MQWGCGEPLTGHPAGFRGPFGHDIIAMTKHQELWQMQTCLHAGGNKWQQLGNLGNPLGLVGWLFLWKPFGFPNPIHEAALGLIGVKQM